ncbi:MAG: biotin synthase BioB [Alphaproteobacteria bacterium]
MAMSSALQDIKSRATGGAPIRHDWTETEAGALMALPFAELMFRAQTVHRQNFDPNAVQISTLLSIKTGSCPEDCAYCPQSAHYDTGLEREALMATEDVAAAARRAREAGASRFCMGAAWRSPTDSDLEQVCDMLTAVRAEGLETCVTLGMLTGPQAHRLKQAGLDYYNHNIDTSPDYYGEIITTRNFDDRLETLAHLRDAEINVCCGGIVGMGETPAQRAGMLAALACLPKHPESVPINMLVPVAGTPLADTQGVDAIEFTRTIATARIMMPRSMVRLSAGRADMTDEAQALCFLAGANSIFYGDTLLTTDNPVADADKALFDRLGIEPMTGADA